MFFLWVKRGFLILLCSSFYQMAFSAVFEYQIKGLEQDKLKNVQIRFSKALAQDKPKTEYDIKAWYQQSLQLIKDTLSPFGYFKPGIQSKLIDQNGVWIGNYKVELGPPLKVTQCTYQLKGAGSNDPQLKQKLDELLMQSGQIMSTPEYEDMKEKLYQMVRSQGYLDVRWLEHKVMIDLERYRAVIILILETGPLYYFGPIVFNQIKQKKFDETFLKRYIPFKTGDRYSSDGLTRLQEALAKSNYFQYVLIKALPTTTNNQKPLEITLIPRLPNRYILSAGYDTDNAFRLGFEWEVRYLNTLGHRFKLRSQISEHLQDLGMTYTLPSYWPEVMWYELALHASRQVLFEGGEKKGTEVTPEASISVVYQTDTWKWAPFLSYQIVFKTKQDGSKQNEGLLIPGINGSWMKLYQGAFINNGHNLKVSLYGSTSLLVSSFDFFRAELEGKWVKSFTSNNYIILRSKLGYLSIKDKNFDRLPDSIKFFAGGSQSIRGYGDQELGPGAHLLVASAEYQHRLRGNWFLAGFFDIGGVDKKGWLQALKRGTGVGLVWVSPLGPVELSLAHGLDDPQDPFKFYFSISSGFL